MDFRNLCQKLDVDSIRAKFPHFPALPALPQIKLPKALPKLKSRKIFRSSREDVNRNSPQKQLQQQQSLGSQAQLAPPIPPADFIKHTPTRISTISSLMHQDSGEDSTYRSAGSIDDDYTMPSYHSSALRPISPIRTSRIAVDGQSNAPTGSNTQIKMSLSERLQRSYKDLSDFRLKNIFVKKTVVRRDSIRVEHYVTRYEEDLRRETAEQERRDRAIAENYTFRFKVSRQNSGHSNSVTPDDSPRSEPIFGRSVGRTVGEHSGDESGMEATPPPRKPGIAATRFARVRSPPLRQSSSEQQSEQEEEKSIQPEPNESTLWGIQRQKQQQQQQKDEDDETKPEEGQQPQVRKSKFSYKERMRRFTSYMSTQEDSDPAEPRAEGTRGSTKMLAKLKGMGKRSEPTESDATKQNKQKLQSSPRSSDEEQASPQAPNVGSPSGKAFTAIKHNFKRLQQSIKQRSQHNATDESGDESAAQKSKSPSKTEKLTSRLRRFRSRDVSVEDLDAEDETVVKRTSAQSPIRQAISNKLDTWKKSFKKKPSKTEETAQGSDGETSPEKEKPEKQKRSDTLIKKLRHIRARKSVESKEDLDANTDGEAPDEPQKTKSRAAKFTEARQRTLKKVNEKMQNMKFFHKSQEQHEPHNPTTSTSERKYHSEEEDWDESPQHEHEYEHEPTTVNLPPTITRRDFPPPHEHSPEQEYAERMAISAGTISIPAARAAWTTKPILSQSMESDIDPSELPRVLIHQDNSDSFESTLIIAVTRPVISSSPLITEIRADEEVQLKSPRAIMLEKSPQQDWVPNQKIIADFREATPPRSNRKSSNDSSISGHKRKLSMDSSSNSDSDSWLPESRGSKNTSRRTSQAGLVSIDEKGEAWKVKTTGREDGQPLYKTKSIDIFEKSVLKGGVLTAFEDFDEELRNEPVLKIATKRNVDSFERESSEDTADDDNSSRITKISVNRLAEESVDVVVAQTSSKKANEKTMLQYGNSRESLIANFDENEENCSNEEEEEDDDEDDRPPSAAPSPPPKMSPPPPPLPQRQPSIRFSKKTTEMPPPLPKSKPPPLAPAVTTRQAVPPRIPERTASMARAPKPLVKTSSLRLVYSEQVKPADIGKVNKLISKFEPTEGNTTQRPRVIPRRMPQDDSEEYSDEEEDYAAMADKLKERYANIKIERDSTPTPTPTNTPKQRTPEAKETPQKTSFHTENPNLQIRIKRELIVPMVVTTTDEDNNVQILTQPIEMRPTTTSNSTIDLPLDTNSNNSRPNSEYGSPLEYPSSLSGSLETIPILERRDANGQRLRSVDRRGRRSMTRENENFYSFDSDEENSYYSISSTGSNRYIVEL